MDILGFVLIMAVFMAPPTWAREAFSRMRDALRSLRERLPGYEAIIRSFLVKYFLIAALLVSVFEVVWLRFMGLDGAQLVHERLWYYTKILIYGQLILAVWNYAWGRLTRQNFSFVMYPVLVPMRNRWDRLSPIEQADRPWHRSFGWWHNNVLSRSPKLAAPYLWLMLVGATTLVQGWDTQLQAIGLPYGDAQKFIALGFASKLVCGFITVVVGTVVGLMIRKGTRFVETVSTLAAKMGVGGLPGITIPDALKEVGGPVDLLDEAYLASFVDFLLNSPILPFFFWDIAVFLWPHAYIAKLVFSGIVIVAALTWLFVRKGDAARAEVAKDLEMSNRILFKLSMPMVAVVLVAGIFLEEAPAGRNFKNGMIHAWYGVTSYAYGPWWQYILPCLIAAGVVVALRRAWYALIKAKKDNADNYKSTLYAYTSIITLFVAIVAGTASVLAISASMASCWEMRPLRLDPQMVKNAVGIHDVITDKDDDLVTMDFWTTKPARGVVEFVDTEATKKLSLPSYMPLLTTDERYQNYHRVQFLAPGYGGAYRIVMRNADETSPEYGKVEVYSFGAGNQVQSQPNKLNEKGLRKGNGAPADQNSSETEIDPPQQQPASRFASAPAKPCPTLLPIPGFD